MNLTDKQRTEEDTRSVVQSPVPDHAEIQFHSLSLLPNSEPVRLFRCPWDI